MTVSVIRRGWGPFTDGWYRSTDGRFEIFCVGWDATPAARVHRSDGLAYGYDLYEGDVKHGRHADVDAAVRAAKRLRSKGRKS
ncbi:hypothetical protein LCGC14_2747620 [marine sediment metagenome]|uniref:Uncharacterized protein n=1 Tax=marine sediment metagenome TaxID=412755 RepID=A0A0F9BBI1_9ZZZZ